jgi:hypothetical protein
MLLDMALKNGAGVAANHGNNKGGRPRPAPFVSYAGGTDGR